MREEAEPLGYAAPLANSPFSMEPFQNALRVIIITTMVLH